MLRTLSVLVFVIACGSKQAPPPSGTPTPVEQTGSAAGGSLTAAQCTAAGGEVVGDIGDGKIHTPE